MDFHQVEESLGMIASLRKFYIHNLVFVFIFKELSPIGGMYSWCPAGGENLEALNFYHQA